MQSIKKMFVSVLGVLCAVFPFGQAKAQAQDGPVIKPVPQDQPARSGATKDELVLALKDLDRNAAEVRIVSATCYKMAAPQPEVQHFCAICGTTSTFKRESDVGILAEQLPNIQRSLATRSYKVSIDASGLCFVCGQGKPKVLVVHMACFECGQDISWDIKNYQDTSLMQWLYVSLPLSELDGNHLGIWGEGLEKERKVRAGVRYIRDHVFCPLHRGQVKLEGDGK